MQLSRKYNVNFQNQDGNAPLHLAAAGGHAAAVRELLVDGGNPNLPNEAGNTPLHLACTHGHASIVLSLLLHRSTDCNVRNASGQTARDLAAEAGHLPVLAKAVTESISFPYMRQQPRHGLFWAVQNEDMEELAAVMDTPGMDLKEGDWQSGCTALDMATAQGAGAVASLLRSRGCVHSLHYAALDIARLTDAVDLWKVGTEGGAGQCPLTYICMYLQERPGILRVSCFFGGGGLIDACLPLLQHGQGPMQSLSLPLTHTHSQRMSRSMRCHLP